MTIFIFKQPHHLLLMALIYLAVTVGAFGQTSYETEIQQWRQQREASLKAEDGWLSVSGLFWLKEGTNTLGSDANRDIVLPENSAPGKVGSLELRNGVVTLNVLDGVAASVNDHPARVQVLKSDADNQTPDSIKVGDLKLTIIKRGERIGLRVRDKNSRARREFTGLRWFPVRDSYRVEATFTPFEKPKEITITNVLGDEVKMSNPGILSFKLNGRELQLKPVVEEEGKLFIIFRDLTAGKTTYPAGRFLDADMPKDGKVILDFNEATNPPCAFTSYATCPLPPRQNYLPVAIEAGEQSYHLKPPTKSKGPRAKGKEGLLLALCS
jgi:uncharacterized protein (DUF1684 family)